MSWSSQPLEGYSHAQDLSTDEEELHGRAWDLVIIMTQGIILDWGNGKTQHGYSWTIKATRAGEPLSCPPSPLPTLAGKVAFLSWGVKGKQRQVQQPGGSSNGVLCDMATAQALGQCEEANAIKGSPLPLHKVKEEECHMGREMGVLQGPSPVGLLGKTFPVPQKHQAHKVMGGFRPWAVQQPA